MVPRKKGMWKPKVGPSLTLEESNKEENRQGLSVSRPLYRFLFVFPKSYDGWSRTKERI